VIIGINVSTEDIEKTITFPKEQHQVKLLSKTYGIHDIIFTVVCDKADVGTCIYNLRNALHELEIKVDSFDTSASVTWEKIDVTPY